MKLINLKIKGFKNLTGPDGWFEIDFENKNGITVLVGNNGSGKSNVLEAISAIFVSMQADLYSLNFDFILKYSVGKDVVEIKYFLGEKFNSKYQNGTEILVNNIKKDALNFRKFSGRQLMAPIKLIANYSGEESRLYETYYKYFYDKFISDGIDNADLDSKVIFISKNHWEIALITLAGSDYNLESILGDKYISKIKISYNDNIEKFFKTKPESIVNNFAKRLKDFGEELEFATFQLIADSTHEELYKKLAISMLHKEVKNRLFNGIEVIFDDGTTAKELSEGEKKQILMFFIFEFLANKDSIILLDEPDSYIHVGNKERLKDIFEKFRNDFGEGEIILTTHSPTLMSLFGDEHLEFLEKGKINKEEKRKILDQISAGKMSYTETEIFLHSKKPVLLVVEGKTDVKHIRLAAEKLNIDLEFDIFAAGSAAQLKEFLNGLPNNMFEDKVVIGIFDYDQAGLKQLKNTGEVVEDKKISKIKKVQENDNENIYAISLPCPNEGLEKYENCPIEFLYQQDKLRRMVKKRTLGEVNRLLDDSEKLNLQDLESKTELCYYKVSESDMSKNNFVKECKNFNKKDFEGFKTLFDKILEIKNREE